MAKLRKPWAIFVAVCLLFGALLIPGMIASAEVTAGIKIADTAKRAFADAGLNFEAVPEGYTDTFNNYYVSGGSKQSYLWNTGNVGEGVAGGPAVFRFNLPDGATSFEPYFVAKDYAAPFTISASSNGTDWLPVAKMNNAYTQDIPYNSTTGLTTGGNGFGTATAGNDFDELIEANVEVVLQNNPSKVVYLKVSHIGGDVPDQYGRRIQLRAFGITYTYTGSSDDGTDDDGVGAFAQGIKVANTAKRADYDPSPDIPEYFNNFYVSGGEGNNWLWTTTKSSPAVFRFDLPDSSFDFEPYFETGSDPGPFKIYASKNGTDGWLEVAANSSTEKDKLYNSTTGLSTGEGAYKATEGRPFTSLNTANIATILTDNSTKTVYLKVDDLTLPQDGYGERTGLRAFGITYSYIPETVNQSIMIADTAKRAFTGADEGKNHSEAVPTGYTDVFNNYYVSGGQPLLWLWKTLPDDAAIFRFDLPNTAMDFEPYFEGEDAPTSFKIYASKNGTDNWLEVAVQDSAYTKNRVYNSTTGLSTGANGYGKATEGHAFSSLNTANIETILTDNDTKVVYLKIGDLTTNEIQLRSFGITYSYTGDDVPHPGYEGGGGGPVEPTYPTFSDPYDNDPKYKVNTEFRIAVGGEYNDDIKTYTEAELAKGALQGVVVDGQRELRNTECNTFVIEVDPDAVFLKLIGWEDAPVDMGGGATWPHSQMCNISLYSEESEGFVSIGDYGWGTPTFEWKYIDNTWGRDANNEWIVTQAGINPETGKKILTLRLMGRFQGDAPESINDDGNKGLFAYKSFIVQTVVPVERPTGESSVPPTGETSKPTDNEIPATGDHRAIWLVILALASTVAATLVVTGKRRNYRAQ